MQDGYLTVKANYLFPNILWQVIPYSSLILGTNIPHIDIVLINFRALSKPKQKGLLSLMKLVNPL